MAELRVFESPEALALALAREIARMLAATPSLTLGLPAGHTPIRLYGALARLHRRGRADFRSATVFGLDEFLGIGASDSRSFQALVRRHLLDRVNVQPRRIHFLNGKAANPSRECARYEQTIARAGGIDLLILGVGRNGHVGFNEPGTRLVGPTHRATLTLVTRRANAETFNGRLTAVPTHALTMGMATIMRARRIVLMATGGGKAPGVARMLNGEVTTDFPASLLQLHPNAEVWADRDASANL